MSAVPQPRPSTAGAGSAGTRPGAARVASARAASASRTSASRASAASAHAARSSADRAYEPRPDSRPDSRPESRHESRPTLQVVRGLAPARSSLPFLVAILVILAAALVSSMLLNAAMADTAFKMQKSQIELNIVNDHIDTVRTQLHDAAASDHLAKRASELGMVPAEAPGVVDLNSSKTSGGSAAEAQEKK